MARDSKNEIRLRIHKRIRSKVAGTEAASSAGCVPQLEPHLCPVDRR